MNETPVITVTDVANLLAGNYDEVEATIRQAVVTEMAKTSDYVDDLIESLPVTVRAWDDGSSEEVDCDHGDDYGSEAESLWDGADYGDGDYCVTVSWEATDAAGREIDMGSFDLVGKTAEPDCPDGPEHDWTAEGEGGCSENPGVWSTGGTSMVFHTHCRACGLKRIERTTGSQRNPGECDTTEYTAVESWCEECQSEECECQE